MKKRKYEHLRVKLTVSDRKIVDAFLTRGSGAVRVIRRNRVLDLLDQGYTCAQIASILQVTSKTARCIGWKYVNHGLERATKEGSRPGKKRKLTDKQANMIIAMVCAEAPAGRARWTLDLIVQEASKRRIVDKIGAETIRVLLHSHDLKPWREKKLVHSGRIVT